MSHLLFFLLLSLSSCCCSSLHLHTLPNAESSAIRSNIDILPFTSASAASSIQIIQMQSNYHSLAARDISVQPALQQIYALFALLHNNLQGGGGWAVEPQTKSQAALSNLKAAAVLFDQSKTTAKQAYACATAAAKTPTPTNDDTNNPCTTLVGVSQQQLTKCHSKIIVAHQLIDVAKQKLLASKATSIAGIGDIIDMARKSASSVCVELEKWLAIVADMTGKVQNSPPPPADPKIKLEMASKTKQIVQQKQQQLRESSALRGASEEKRKELEATKAHEALEQSKPSDASQCEHMNHCRDPMWSKSSMNADGCVHGCADALQQHAGVGCPALCQKSLQQVFTGSDIDADDTHTFLLGCTKSCQGLLTERPPKGILWRADQVDDKEIVVPHGGGGGTREGSKGSSVDVRLDHVTPLKKGHGFRCNETMEWKPCFATCNQVHGLKKCVKRSACIYGCRIVLVRSLPTSTECLQYCNEVVDQVMGQTFLYGNDTLIGEDANTAKSRKNKLWSATCRDSCVDTFAMRTTAFDGVDPC